MEELKKLKEGDIPEGWYVTITGRLIEYQHYWIGEFKITPDKRLVYVDTTREGSRYYTYNEEILGRVRIVCKIRRKKRIFI